MKRALIIGGANGIGLGIATELANRNDIEKVYIVDKDILSKEFMNSKFETFQFNLLSNDYSFFNKFNDIDVLMITAGIGKLQLFKDVEEDTISTLLNVNTISAIRIIKKFYNKINSKDDFYCGVMVSIAGFMSSPFFSIYGASKAALKIFIESINVELLKDGVTNRVLNISPGSIKGTGFNGNKTNLLEIANLAREIIAHLQAKDDLFIPEYEEIYKTVLERYHSDFRKEGEHSYDYKVNSGRVSSN
mgnify:CR=1 FL=1